MEWNNQLVFGGQGIQPIAAFTFFMHHHDFVE